jgi:hypothetical protein
MQGMKSNLAERWFVIRGRNINDGCGPATEKIAPKRHRPPLSPSSTWNAAE